ncbi:MAG: ParM/StbA family protein, partial [Ruminococcus sp.]|nr:ParM/StbA family protein [Ruminococcus sp.]
MVIGIDHGFYAIKGAHVVFPSGLTAYDYEPYTMQNVLQYGEKYYVCGTERQALLKDKTVNDNYYLLTMAALAQELRYRNADKRMEIILAAGLPLAGFGREKQAFQKYFLRKERPLGFQYEGEEYRIWIRDVKLFPQGYSAIALHPEYVKDEPSVLLADIGGWTVDLMRLDNAVPNAATCRSLELGVIRCMDEAMEQIRRRTGLSVTDIQIERVLNGSGCSMDETAKEMIHRQGRIYTQIDLGDLLRRQAGYLRQLRQRRFPAQLVAQPLP